MSTVYGENNQFTIYKKNGNKLMEGQMLHKKLEGEVKLFQKNQLIAINLYKEGKREGPFFMFNPKSGLLFKKGFYQNDKKQGELIVFDDKGSIIAKEIYENDVLLQKIGFYPTGELLKDQLYQKGIEYISKIYYRSGALLEEKYFDPKGVLLKSARYLENGHAIETFDTKICKKSS